MSLISGVVGLLEDSCNSIKMEGIDPEEFKADLSASDAKPKCSNKNARRALPAGKIAGRGYRILFSAQDRKRLRRLHRRYALYSFISVFNCWYMDVWYS